MPHFKKKIESAKEEEAEGIKNYGKLAREGKPRGMGGMLKGIQSDEKKHHSKLSKALKGLKNAH